MRIGYIMSPDRGATDRALMEAAAVLRARGLRLAGVVQTNTDCPGTHHCDMDVQVLPDGATFRISQALGAGSHGCRLDPGALELAVAAVGATLTDDTDALILNKFGKHEAEGRGFRDLIAEALSRGIPVVAGVNRLNEAAFLDYAGAMAEALPADPARVADWVQATQAQALVA